MSKTKYKHYDFVANEKAKMGRKPHYNDQYRFSRKTFRVRDQFTNVKKPT